MDVEEQEKDGGEEGVEDVEGWEMGDEVGVKG